MPRKRISKRPSLSAPPADLIRAVTSLADAPLPPEVLGYIQAFFQDETHRLILERFEDLASQGMMTRSILARRLGVLPEQVTRWFSAPGNWELNTVAGLASALGRKPVIGLEKLDGFNSRNPNQEEEQ